MGFENKKNGKPALAWVTLRELAKSNGVLQATGNGQTWAMVEKRVQEIRVVLRRRFGLADDPLPFSRKRQKSLTESGYRAAFKIGCRLSFEA
jgi:hypothetical protein